jgi:hypothetical protein
MMPANVPHRLEYLHAAAERRLRCVLPQLFLQYTSERISTEFGDDEITTTIHPGRDQHFH